MRASESHPQVNEAETSRRDPSVPAPRILVVDDEPVLAELLVDSLTFAGYDVRVARTGSEALTAAARLEPDLIVLDVNLPDFNGFVVAARLRTSGDTTPIVFLTARDAPTDLRDGFGSGGDDYLTKPFRLEELRLRVEAVLRRTMDRPVSQPSTLIVADLVIDTVSRQVWRGDAEVSLSLVEYKLLRFLATHPNKVYSSADLLRHVWGSNAMADAQAVADSVAQLQRKIGSLGPTLIDTVSDLGYVLRLPKP